MPVCEDSVCVCVCLCVRVVCVCVWWVGWVSVSVWGVSCVCDMLLGVTVSIRW